MKKKSLFFISTAIFCFVFYQNIKAISNSPVLFEEDPGDIAYDYLMVEVPCDPEETYFYDRCEPEHPKRYCIISAQTLCETP